MQLRTKDSEGQVKIQLDIAGDDIQETVTAQTQEWAQKFNVKATLVAWQGPAGGNPDFMFTGKENDVINLVKDYVTGMFNPTNEKEATEEAEYLIETFLKIA